MGISSTFWARSHTPFSCSASHWTGETGDDLVTAALTTDDLEGLGVTLTVDQWREVVAKVEAEMLLLREEAAA